MALALCYCIVSGSGAAQNLSASCVWTLFDGVLKVVKPSGRNTTTRPRLSHGAVSMSYEVYSAHSNQ